MSGIRFTRAVPPVDAPDNLHHLVVGPFDPDDDTDRFDIEHPDTCLAHGDRVDGVWQITSYGCGVGFHEECAGIDAWFVHADDATDLGREQVAEGRHPIEAWSETVHRSWAGDEYTGGIRLASPSPLPGGEEK